MKLYEGGRHPWAGTLVSTFKPSSIIDTTAWYQFRPDSSVSVSADKKYWVTVNENVSSEYPRNYGYTEQNREVGATGWRIGDNALRNHLNEWADVTYKLRMSVVGTIKTSSEPKEPTNLMATVDGTNEITLSWSAPSDDGDADITGYRIEHSFDPVYNFKKIIANTNSTDTTFVDKGQSYGTTNYYRVNAINANGNGPYSSNAIATIAPAITSEHDTYGAGVEDVVFKLTRDGSTEDVLVDTVTITQDQEWLTELSHEVTIPAGSNTALLTLGHADFSLTPTASGVLTATVGTNSKTVEVVTIAAPPITISFDSTSYSFPEETPTDSVKVLVVATLDSAYPRAPSVNMAVSVNTTEGSAKHNIDYVGISKSVGFEQSDYVEQSGGSWVASLQIERSSTEPGIPLYEDHDYEGDEQFDLNLSWPMDSTINPGVLRFANPDGTFCETPGCTMSDSYPVTITDEADRPVLALTVDPSTIAEEDDSTTTVNETVSTITASITNGKTFADSTLLTLTFGGTATAGEHYLVNPADEDGDTEGHQLVLAAGDSTVTATVTATSNDSEDGSRSVTVAGSWDGMTFGDRTIWINDDEANRLPTFDEGVETTRTIEETLGATEATAANVGNPVTATDADGDTLVYSVILNSTSPVPIAIDSTTGQLKLQAGTRYSYEAIDGGSFSVTVRVKDGEGGFAEIDVTVRVTDLDEPPLVPKSLSVTAQGETTLRVTWSPPKSNLGRPFIESYDLQYRQGTSGGWSDGPQDYPATSARNTTINDLAVGSIYQVRVRATNDEGKSRWSEPGSGVTDTADNTTDGPDLQGVDLPGRPRNLRAAVIPRPNSPEGPGIPRMPAIRVTWSQPSNSTRVSVRLWVLQSARVSSCSVSPDSWNKHVRTLDEVTKSGDKTVFIHYIADGAYHYRVAAYGYDTDLGPYTDSVCVDTADFDRTPPPLPGIRVADARVREGPGAKLRFALTLDQELTKEVKIQYRTIDGTATNNFDYETAVGSVVFNPGETMKTVEVEVLDDALDEGNETMSLRIDYYALTARAQIVDRTATGTIENNDPLPRAMLARFGRATALHVTDQVESRLQASRSPGLRGRVAGLDLRQGMVGDMARDYQIRLLSSAVAAATDTAGGQPGPGAMAVLRSGIVRGDLLTGTGFVLNRPVGRDASVSLWSRGTESRFSGREGRLSLGGAVRSAMLGADYARGPVTAGLMLSHRRGLGRYYGVGAPGEVTSTLTGIHPWAGYRASERVTLWGVTGYGRGSLNLVPGGTAVAGATPLPRVEFEGGLSMAMLAAGVRGELVNAGAGGFALAFKADALWVSTASEAVDSPAGRLAASTAVVTRVRTTLEASKGYALQRAIALKPSLEIGIRQDGGDAERGAGADLAGRLVAKHASTGLSIDVHGRTLLVHEAEGFRDRGVSVSISYDSTPSTPLGLNLRIAPSWGGRATSGADALWDRQTLAGLGAGNPATGQRMDVDLGYAIPIGSRLVGTPAFGVRTSSSGRDYRLAYSLGTAPVGAVTFRFGLDAVRHTRIGHTDANHRLGGRFTLNW